METKEAKIGARESDREWSYLRFTGKIVVNEHKGKTWVLLDVHKGLCEAAYANLKAEGVSADPKFDHPHISVFRPNEVDQIKKKFGIQWRGAVKEGQMMQFRLEKMVSLMPAGWAEVSRVWFLEVKSPDLSKLREDLGFHYLPKHEDSQHEMRFHITFAVLHNHAKKAQDILTEKRAEAGVGEGEVFKPQDESGAGLAKTFNKMELDPTVTQATLGQEFKNAGIPMMLRTSQKLLNIQKGTEEVDDRDSLAFQTLHSPEDFFAERIHKDAGQIGKKLLWKSTLRGNLKHVPSGALTPQLRAVLLRSGLGMPIEEINPLDVYDQHLRVLRLGEGGIPSNESVPDECYDADTEVFTNAGWIRWSSVTQDTIFGCNINDKLEFHRANRLIEKPYSGPMYGIRTRTLDILVTPNHRHWIKKYRGPSSIARCGEAPWEFELAKDSHNAPRQFKITHQPWRGAELERFVLPTVDGARSDYTFKIDDWAEFVGWYAAEGSIDQYALRERSKYHITISQVESANSLKVARISALLTRMGIAFSYQGGHNFCFVSKQLGVYLSSLGTGSGNKKLPEEAFNWPLRARERLLEALIDGDGSTKENGYKTYCTTSAILVEQVIRLACSLGHAARRRTDVEHINPKHNTTYYGSILTSDVQGITDARMYAESYYVQEYNGVVYCAEVPGEKLLVRRNGAVPIWSGNSRNVQPSHFGYIDPIRSPESSSIGVDARIAHGAVKGSDGKIYTSLFNTRTGKKEMIPAEQASAAIVAFPGEMEKDTPKVRAMVSSKQIEFVDRDKVDYVLPSTDQMFSATSNLVPFVSGIKGGRLLMGAKYMIQALPLRHAEAPLVQNLFEKGKSFDDLYGDKAGAVFAKDHGIVQSVTPHSIIMRYSDGTKETHELYHNFPYNRKTFLHNTSVVKVGDEVKPGQILAKSNYTDDKGTLAIGTNLRTAYIPYKGLNYEDAIVISEGAAQKLSSEHMYQHALDAGEKGDMEIGRKEFVSVFPGKFTREQLSNIDHNGTVKPGTVVKYGDPLILALQKNKPTAVHHGHKPIYSDGAVTWHHEGEGIVTDVDRTKDGSWNVTVKAYSPMQEGDKLSGRYGDKGVVSRIIPDHQMPHGQDGKPYEILLNPQGIISRGNPSQLFETLLGKVARKRGEAYKVPGFNKEHLTDLVERELKKAKLTDTEDLIDPTTGHKIPGVLTGERFIMKLHHMAEHKNVGRDVGAYTSEGIPARGGELGAKRVSNMEQNALLSHGATSVLRDAQVIRGQRNDEFWRAFRMGLTPPPPKVPIVFNKFLSYLEGSGVHIKRDGSKLQLFALTNKDIDEMSAGAIENGNTVTGDQLKPVKGGLFDESLTGGHEGNRWSHINLHEPVPNPVMEDPIKRLLGLTGKEYEAILSGKKALYGETGGLAIKTALSKINIDGAIEYNKGIIRDGAKSKRDHAVKALGYLKSLQKYNLNPADWVLDKVPVLPPHFRPITVFKGMQMSADPNYLYRDLMLANNDLRDLKGNVADEQLGEERLKVYKSFKAITGLGDPVQPKTQEKQVKGLLAHVFGSSPKLGMFQRRVIGSPVDVVGRAVITPNPELSMDQVGLPESKAWTIYRPFIMRRLIRSGMPATDAAKAVANQADVARKSMLAEMKERPVMINRAPTLHRYSFLAAWPILTKGNTLQIPPVLTKGFNADFDGDAMNYHVPVDPEAVKDAINLMMPSNNLRSVRDFKVHYLPLNEFLMGLYLASGDKSKRHPRIFHSQQDVIAAFHRGEISANDPVTVK